MSREVTEIRLDEHGDETHESWILIGASRVQSTKHWLFDSEIPHQHFVVVTVTRCSRRRDLNHDYLYGRERLAQFSMSMAQWGAFVSSFGVGQGVPATLEFLTGVGHVPQAPVKPRFEESHREVRESGDKALEEIQASYAKVMEAFETGGKRALREALTSLGYTIQNGPANMEFAASSFTKHIEGVVTKARADIETAVYNAQRQGVISEVPLNLLPPGPEED